MAFLSYAQIVKRLQNEPTYIGKSIIFNAVDPSINNAYNRLSGTPTLSFDFTGSSCIEGTIRYFRLTPIGNAKVIVYVPNTPTEYALIYPSTCTVKFGYPSAPSISFGVEMSNRTSLSLAADVNRLEYRCGRGASQQHTVLLTSVSSINKIQHTDNNYIEQLVTSTTSTLNVFSPQGRVQLNGKGGNGTIVYSSTTNGMFEHYVGQNFSFCAVHGMGGYGAAFALGNGIRRIYFQSTDWTSLTTSFYDSSGNWVSSPLTVYGTGSTTQKVSVTGLLQVSRAASTSASDYGLSITATPCRGLNVTCEGTSVDAAKIGARIYTRCSTPNSMVYGLWTLTYTGGVHTSNIIGYVNTLFISDSSTPWSMKGIHIELNRTSPYKVSNLRGIEIDDLRPASVYRAESIRAKGGDSYLYGKLDVWDGDLQVWGGIDYHPYTASIQSGGTVAEYDATFPRRQGFLWATSSKTYTDAPGCLVLMPAILEEQYLNPDYRYLYGFVYLHNDYTLRLAKRYHYGANYLPVDPITDGSNPIVGLNYFGDGRDGDVTIYSNTFMTRDIYANNLTVTAGSILDTAGYRIFVRKKLTVDGTIRCNGAPGVGSMPGFGISSGFGLLLGGNGGSGGAGSGEGGISVVGLGGNGGNGGGAGGGGGGKVTTSNMIPISDIASLLNLRELATTSMTRYTGGAGGGGGSGFIDAWDEHPGGGGGQGGGPVIIAAQFITGSGSIEAKGGDGAPAPETNTYGGGGGGGGVIVIVYCHKGYDYALTLNVSGGQGYNGGQNGQPGQIIWWKVN